VPGKAFLATQAYTFLYALRWATLVVWGQFTYEEKPIITCICVVLETNDCVMNVVSPNISALSGPITCVLGPTNTGKTHLAISRMLGHSSGVIGLPLRLLAREVYDRICMARGAASVALITGEEKIVPVRPRYWVATVEAMPLSIVTDFLCVDEIQLAADPDRGHVFTDRLLRARGLSETMFLGAETMRPVLKRLLPDAEFVSRPRLSSLSYLGQKKISRLPRRTAIVTFSADEVYAIAELIKRQKGGAAIVMGALSPRTRNAQVALYESGDVDFLVATDAIGMGLNLDVNHVAFGALEKFDGRLHRPLTPAETAQIAGRAGRHMNDGTFGTTGEAPALEAGFVEQIENHQFDPVRALQWRNSVLNFGSVEHLIASLEVPSGRRMLQRGREAIDVQTLKALAKDAEIRDLVCGNRDVEKLWDVAQIPDFRKTVTGAHVALARQIFLSLASPAAVLDPNWVEGQLRSLDNAEGNIDLLSTRLAHIRTWTYIANRPGWLSDPVLWQERTQGIEERLSDALHDCLTQRFVDRRTSVLMRRLKQKETLLASVNDLGEVEVEGEYIGRVKGFRFEVDPKAEGSESKTLRAAAAQILDRELGAQVGKLIIAGPGALSLSDNCHIVWNETDIATLQAGSDVLNPQITVLAEDNLPSISREALETHLATWLKGHIQEQLGALLALKDGAGFEGLAKGLAFRLVEGLGNVDRSAVAEDVKQMTQEERGLLRKAGVRFAEYSIYVPALLKPAPTKLKLALWGLFSRLDAMPIPPTPGLVTVSVVPDTPPGFYGVCGFRRCGPVVIRIDMVERIADMLRTLTKRSESNKRGEFEVNPDLMSLAGRSGEDFDAILKSLGYISRVLSPDELKALDAVVATEQAPEAPEAQGTEQVNADPGSTVQAEADIAPQKHAEASNPDATSEPEKPAEEPKPRLVWRRKGPQRPREEKRSASARNTPQKGRTSSKSTNTPPKRPKPSKPREKPMDPTSPFAALAGLKEKLKG